MLNSFCWILSYYLGLKKVQFPYNNRAKYSCPFSADLKNSICSPSPQRSERPKEKAVVDSNQAWCQDPYPQLGRWPFVHPHSLQSIRHSNQNTARFLRFFHGYLVVWGGGGLCGGGGVRESHQIWPLMFLSTKALKGARWIRDVPIFSWVTHV